MAFQITGKILAIGQTVAITPKSGGEPFYRREFVLDCTRYNPDTGEPWENFPKFELGSRNVGLIDGFQAGQRVTVDFVLRGSKYQDQQTGETKYFTSVTAIKIAAAEHQEQPYQPPYAPQPAPQQYAPAQQWQQPSPQPYPPVNPETGLPF